MADKLQQKVVVISGAGSEAGTAIVRAALDQGALVVAADDAESIRDFSQAGSVWAAELDVTDEAGWSALFAQTLEKHGRLDGLVNCASLSQDSLLEDTTLEQFQQINRINVDGTFLGTKLAVQTMRQCAADGDPARGSIVNVGSVLATIGKAGAAAYCASQGAVRILTKSVAVECGQRRDEIRVNSVHAAADTFDADAIPLGRAGETGDVAGAVVFLLSDESRLMTGAEITVDGGWTAQ